MLFDVSDEEINKAKLPHDLFLLNLIGNHILTFVATLGLANSWIWPVFIVPILSIIILSVIIIKGRKSRKTETWYVMCHWQIALQRSLFFIKMLLVLMTIAGLGLYGYTHFGWMKEAVYALIGGVCILPVMVTTLILIIMESDALYQASQGKLPERIVSLFPKP